MALRRASTFSSDPETRALHLWSRRRRLLSGQSRVGSSRAEVDREQLCQESWWLHDGFFEWEPRALFGGDGLCSREPCSLAETSGRSSLISGGENTSSVSLEGMLVKHPARGAW